MFGNWLRRISVGTSEIVNKGLRPRRQNRHRFLIDHDRLFPYFSAFLVFRLSKQWMFHSYRYSLHRKRASDSNRFILYFINVAPIYLFIWSGPYMRHSRKTVKVIPVNVPSPWCSYQSSWLQTQRTGFASRRYQISEKYWVWNGVHSAS
jgi:hypothetical protein